MSTTSNNKKSSKGNQKAKQRNLNNENILSLKRLALAIQELDKSSSSSNNKNLSSPGSSNNGPLQVAGNTSATIITVPPIHHWRDIPADIMGAYKMLHDGAQLIKTISTKYTLMGKISLEDGSKLSTELRQGCELLSTAAFLVHSPHSGCARSTRVLVKQRSLAVIQNVTILMESFVSTRALEGNVGAQLTGAVWQACDEVMDKTPKGNRACMMREMFTWVRDCDETMQEFEELVALGPISDDDDNNEKGIDDGNTEWDDFCENLGTGEQYTNDEISIVKSCLALIKCSRGVIGLTLKALECAGSAVEGHIVVKDAEEENKGDMSHYDNIFQWMGNLHETCRKIAQGVTNIGCVMYPPLNVSLIQNENGGDDDANNDNEAWTRTEIGRHAIQQKDWLLSVTREIEKPNFGSDNKCQIEMSAEVREMCNKLLVAIEKRTSDIEHAIQQKIIIGR